MKKFLHLTKFFIKTSRGYLGTVQRFKIKSFWYWDKGLCRGSSCYWYYPFSFKNLLRLPVAYIKFMYYSYN